MGESAADLVSMAMDLRELKATRGKGNRQMTKLSEYVKTAEAAEILGVAWFA